MQEEIKEAASQHLPGTGSAPTAASLRLLNPSRVLLPDQITLDLGTWGKYPLNPTGRSGDMWVSDANVELTADNEADVNNSANDI